MMNPSIFVLAVLFLGLSSASLWAGLGDEQSVPKPAGVQSPKPATGDGTEVEPDWRKAADERIERIRKGDFNLRVLDARGRPIAGRDVAIHQVGHHFHFGVSVTETALQGRAEWNQRYRQFILDHFNTVVSDDSMKWYSLERERGVRTYNHAEVLMAFAREHGMSVRGHALFWSKPRFIQPWVQELDDRELRKAIDDHIRATVTRFRGRLVAWDVNNEMLTGSFYRDRLGDSIRAHMFRRAAELDPKTPLFVNEYDILGNDEKLGRMIELIRSLQKAGAPIGGIGIQEHAAERTVPERPDAPPEARDEVNVERQSHVRLDPPKMLARLDRLAELKLPIHLTEISFKTRDDLRRAQAVEDFYRMGFSHPAVEAIVLWGFWGRLHWLGDEASLLGPGLEPLEPAVRLNRLLNETWKTRLESRTDDEGRVAFRGFFGEYEVRVGEQVIGRFRHVPGQSEGEVRAGQAAARPAAGSDRPAEPAR